MEIQCNRSYFFFLSFFLPLLFKFDFDDIKTCLRMREFKKKNIHGPLYMRMINKET